MRKSSSFLTLLGIFFVLLFEGLAIAGGFNVPHQTAKALDYPTL